MSIASPPAPRLLGTRSTFRVLIGIVLVLAGLVSVIVLNPLLARDDANPRLGHGRLFLYFTVQANVLAVIASLVVGVGLLRGHAPSRPVEYLRGLAVVDMAITGIVYAVLFFDPRGPVSITGLVLDQAGPLLMVIWWIAMPPVRPLSLAAAPIWLAHPLFWTAMTLA